MPHSTDDQYQYVTLLQAKLNSGSYDYPEGISQVLDFLYVGGEDEADDVDLLIDTGITHVINCATGYCDTGTQLYGEQFKYMGFAAEDEEGYDIMQHFNAVYEFIEDARLSDGKAFIHCLAGMNRSVVLAAVYIMYHKNIGPISAVLMIREARGIVLFNETFQKALINLAAEKNMLARDREMLTLASK